MFSKENTNTVEKRSYAHSAHIRLNLIGDIYYSYVLGRIASRRMDRYLSDNSCCRGAGGNHCRWL